MSSALNYVRLYADHAGESHFEPVVVETFTRNFAPPAPAFNVSRFVPALRSGFLLVPAGWIGDLHPSPLRMWVFVLDGEVEFEASDGERQPARPGDALLLEDTIGRGLGAASLATPRRNSQSLNLNRLVTSEGFYAVQTRIAEVQRYLGHWLPQAQAFDRRQ